MTTAVSQTLRPLIVLAGTTAFLFSSHPCMADGALAVAVGPNNAFASGSALNAPSPKIASTDASESCRGSTSEASLKQLCKVVATFSNKCFAIAFDPQDGEPGTGWAVANTQQAADEQAMQQCRATAGADRVQFCIIPSGGGPQGQGDGRSRGCDGNAR